MTAPGRDEPAPPWAYAPIELAPHDPAWQRRAVELARRLNGLLARWRVTPVHHIGSTAVPGLPAKPVIDLMVGVPDPADCDPLIAVLGQRGWAYVPPDLDGRDDERFFVLGYGATRLAHLHLMAAGGPAWDARLTFVRRLRADAVLRDRYAALKADLAERHRDDREAYTRAKAAFIERSVAGGG